MYEYSSQRGRRACILGHGQRTDAGIPKAGYLPCGCALPASGVVGVEAEQGLSNSGYSV